METAVADILVLHATDPASVYLSVLARHPTATIDDIAAALYDDRSVVRMLAMRRTLFVVPAGLVPVVHAAASLGVAGRLRKGLVKDLQTLPTEPELSGDIGRWLVDVEEHTEQAMARRGDATANNLAADEPRLRTALLPTTDRPYDVRRNITTRVLTLMAAEGRLVRNRPRGDWTSRHHTWAPGSVWWPDGIPELPVAEAQVELARRWLAVFGPAPLADLQWWTGWTLGATRAALAHVDTVEVALDDGPGLVLADDTAAEETSRPSAALLPALDPTPMGWQARDWFLGPHRESLFDRNGNIGPTIWWGGEIVGGWATRPDGHIATRLLSDIGARGARAVASAAEKLEARIDGAVVVPSFRTPLERELGSQT